MPSDNLVYVLDTGNCRIISFDYSSGEVQHEFFSPKASNSSPLSGQGATSIALVDQTVTGGMIKLWVTNWRLRKLMILQVSLDGSSSVVESFSGKKKAFEEPTVIASCLHGVYVVDTGACG